MMVQQCGREAVDNRGGVCGVLLWCGVCVVCVCVVCVCGVYECSYYHSLEDQK